MDLANVALYAATQAIEESLLEKAGPPHNLDEDEIQRVHFSPCGAFNADNAARAGHLPT